MQWKFRLLNKPYGRLTEGPVWDGEAVLFTHIPTHRILRYDLDTDEITEWRGGTNYTNGLAYDANGQLFGCCAGGRSIVRFDPDGRTTVVADRLDGKRLNTPNDLAIDLKGRIWFSNPWNERNIDAGAEQELDHQSVLRADPQPDGRYSVTRATFDTTMPNGVLLSRDQRTLYVAESHYTEGLVRQLRAYPINDDGTLGAFTVLHTFGEDHRGVHRGVDGMCLDTDGNIIACAGWEVSGPGALIYVISPTGRVVETQLIPALRPTNCCFAGPEMSTLFVTSVGGHLFRAETDRTGWAIYP